VPLNSITTPTTIRINPMMTTTRGGTAVHDAGQQRLHAPHLLPPFPRDRRASIPFFDTDTGQADRGNLESSATRMSGACLCGSSPRFTPVRLIGRGA
jgi:hypothetical protein